jgi:phosphotransferase family enzyme
VPIEPSSAVKARAAAVLGWAPSVWRPVYGGYTPAARYVGAAGSERCFLKVATNAITRDMLRREARAYGLITGDFIPDFIGWDDDAEAPLLLIEDLSDAVWPPPWTPALIEQVREAIAAMHRQSVELPGVAETEADVFGGWSMVAENPQPFLGLGLVSSVWLDASLPALLAAEQACELEGEALTHFDLRSDNICITPAGPKFVDWAEACRGNPVADLGAWLPSLEAEGGPPPETLLPGRPEVAAWISGYFAARAGRPIIPTAPRVRSVQRAQLTTALPWAQRALGLPPLS